jgi:hypothetical protein
VCDSQQPANNRKGEEDVQISDYRMWTKSGKDEKCICKAKSVSELSLSNILLFISFSVSVCHNFSSELPISGNINKLPTLVCTGYCKYNYIFTEANFNKQIL